MSKYIEEFLRKPADLSKHFKNLPRWKKKNIKENQKVVNDARKINQRIPSCIIKSSSEESIEEIVMYCSFVVTLCAMFLC